ncbi:hypothetical protein N7462_004975 [Penicillium macrosclerotiorum]|uniref:uncharacterized protein n=1 Tax=Penicillium macrosclerotiorum TaxID=303699 RepID=UPI0025471496|nr:uncharacterized protein N7462_004975 [Penicillium macrosclerotiorum]KAJ5690583.1 hypothetical protein N7462_004975 [Penicillium macrosclerotiorum]
MPPKAAPRRTTAPRQPNDSESTPAAGAASTPQSATPGPGPGRPPAQRLQSLKTRRAPGSITPSAARPPSALAGEPAKPVPMKYKPKAVVRRSEAEREAMRKLEEERNSERLREAAAIKRGRGGRGGRGAFRGRGGPAGMMGAHGPFGSGLGGAKRGGRGGSSTAGRMMMRDGESGSHGFDDDSDEDSSMVRIAIDNIELGDDEDDEESRDIKGKMPIRSREGLRPVRVLRLEHEERVVSVNMESSSNKSAEIRQEKEKAKAAEAAQQKAAEAAQAEPRVKAEPVDDDTPMVDVVPHDDDGFLPTQKVRVRRKLPSPQQKDADVEMVESASPEVVPARDPRELLRTKEEIDEYDRHLEDLDHVRNLLSYEEEQEPVGEKGTVDADPDVQPTTEGEPEAAVEKTDNDGDAEQQEEEDNTNQKLLGQLFLMQFPPMTPNLTLSGSTATTNTTTTTPAERNPSPSPGEVKPEDNVHDLDGPPETPKVITAATDWALPAGRVGKLNVHKSGRVTLDWGGISFELDRATTVDFVQEALIVSSPEPEVEGRAPKEDEQRVWSMGELCGKFTVMPNWDQML